MERSIGDASQAFKAKICCGSLTIWTRYVATSRSFAPRSSYRRSSMLSILLVPLSESVCANSDTYVALEPYYHPRTPFRIQFLISVVSPPPREVPVIYTKGPSMVQRFASNGSGCTSWTVRRKSPKCATDTTISLSTAADESYRRSTRRLWFGSA